MQAVKLDDGLAEAHISLALVRADYDWDWPGAENEFRKAIQLNGNSATAHHWYGDFLTRMERFEEAKLELKKAQELDPLSLLIKTSIGRQLYFSRQYAAAIQQLQKTLEMDPKFVPAQHALEAAYAQSGMYKEAVAERQKVLTLSGNPDLAATVGEDRKRGRGFVDGGQFASLERRWEMLDAERLFEHRHQMVTVNPGDEQDATFTQ